MNRDATNYSPEKIALLKAVDAAGGQTAFAQIINSNLAEGSKPITQQHVWNWLNKTGQIPTNYVIPAEKGLSYQVTRQEFRPALYPSS